ncbi:MAG: hypothetical protein ABI330_09000 [Caldimonas sp.]
MDIVTASPPVSPSVVAAILMIQNPQRDLGNLAPLLLVLQIRRRIHCSIQRKEAQGMSATDVFVQAALKERHRASQTDELTEIRRRFNP